jgi:hypothetical protein
MKKIILTILFVIMASNVFAQWNGSSNTSNVNIEYFGNNDVWFLDKNSDIEDLEDTLTIYIGLDMDRTNWVGFNPIKEGLLNVSFMLEFDKNSNTATFIFAYNSSYELNIANWVIIYNEINNAYLLGGQASAGDTTHKDKLNDGTYIIAAEINLNKDWTQWFAHNQGGDYKIAIMEYTYGDHLIFRLPEELFQKISEIYDEYM